MSFACVCSLTTLTFSGLTYCGSFEVSVCQPTSSIRKVSPFSVVGWPVPLNASQTACLTRFRSGMPKRSGFG